MLKDVYWAAPHPDDAEINNKHWSAAAAFTRERAESVRHKAEEIKVIDTVLGAYVTHGGDVWRRILASLEQQMADLCRGLRPEFVEKAKRGEA